MIENEDAGKDRTCQIYPFAGLTARFVIDIAVIHITVIDIAVIDIAVIKAICRLFKTDQGNPGHCRNCTMNGRLAERQITYYFDGLNISLSRLKRREKVIILSCWIERKRNIVFVEAAIYNNKEELCTKALCTYFTFSQEKAKEEMHFLNCEVEQDEIIPLI